MSSPPNTATSPPYTPHLSIPRKRPSINTSLSSSANFKRHKPASSAGSSAHPLRQTSFPPPEQAVTSPGSPPYSPPADGSVTGRSSTAGTGKRKRGRPRASDARSATGGSAAPSKAGSASGRASVADGSGGGGDAAREDEEPEDDELEPGVDTVLEGDGTTDEAQLKVERQNMRMLIEAFDQDQTARYDMWRRCRLDKPTLRRLVNHTLSQSVPPSVIMTINGYTKLFIGELLERARDVQDEWLAASLTLPTGELKPHLKNSAFASGASNDSSTSRTSSSSYETSMGSIDSITYPYLAYINIERRHQKALASSAEPNHTSQDTSKSQSQGTDGHLIVEESNPDLSTAEHLSASEPNHTSQETSKSPSQGTDGRFVVEERDRGPLTAEHLCEALRRYKKDREGGSAGFQGLSMHGKASVASRAGGRRLFR